MKSHTHAFSNSILLLCSSSFVLSSVVQAQNDEATITQSSLEVIEVYAQKRAQAIEDVSIAVSQVKGDTLKNQHYKDSTELSVFAPNLKISQNAAEGTPPAVNIRGVGLVDYNTANTSPVAIYVDDVAVGSASNQIVNFFDIEQVDILRGPQGTIFGRNATGGAILIRTKRPEFTETGYLTAGVANNHAFNIDAMYNNQLSDSTAFRVAINHQDYQYSTRNAFDQAPTAGMEQTSARLSLLSDFDNLQLLLQGHIEDWQGIVQPVGNIGIIADPLTGERCSASQAGSTKCFDNFGFNDASDDFYTVKVNNDSPHKTDGKGVSAHLTWQVNDRNEVVSISSYNQLERSHAFNCDGSPAQLCEGSLGLDTDLFSQELRLQTQWDGHTLTSGLYFADESIQQNNINDILRDLRGILASDLTATFFYDNQIDTQNIAAFSQLDYQLNADWMISAGLRYSYESLDYDSVAHLNVVIDTADLAGSLVPFYHVQGQQSDNGFSGQIAINYLISDSTHSYYRFANGAKSGGYNGGFLSSPEQAELADYGKERLNAHEVGTKSWWPEQGIRFNWAAFYYDYNDQQVFMNQPSKSAQKPPVQLLENVGDSIIYGLEAEFDYQATDTLSMRLALGYIPHAEFEEFEDPLGNSLTDNRLPFTSKWNASVGVEYQLELAGNPLTTQLLVDYQSEYYFDQNQNPYAMQDGYSIVNGNIRYQVDNFSFVVWGKNLFDTEYSNLKFDLSSFLGMLEDFKGEGRRYGLDVSYQF
ncbi:MULTISPECIES: TonB-dependent receptor [Pseudoalteromonas]|uniref:TonB-dependent receptor n=1 Tax=Pseudoalteromonas TaxID=53246 RepID=UPI0002E3B575|nr:MULTISPECIES: TonB-dependent receptor [Pseudoalteromonas]MCF6142778.1 iron complex outermembrane recepter protein [Pseudoalteromonas mariniglutinosa NCIMB 1770]BDF94476.1 TonB-dependent receptor [Pseudoalteromonas sp. KAN5]